MKTREKRGEEERNTMDLGIFLSNKKKLVVWIIGPVLFLSIVFLPVFIYFKSVNKSLMEKKYMLESMPAIIEKITMAQAMVKSYQSNASKTEIIEWLNSQLNRTAASCGFAIDSLVVAKDDTKSAGGSLIVYAINIKGKGALSKIDDFFSKCQSLMPLLTLDNFTLRTIGETSEQFYEAQVVFAYNSLS